MRKLSFTLPTGMDKETLGEALRLAIVHLSLAADQPSYGLCKALAECGQAGVEMLGVLRCAFGEHNYYPHWWDEINLETSHLFTAETGEEVESPREIQIRNGRWWEIRQAVCAKILSECLERVEREAV